MASRNADISAELNGKTILAAEDINILPEIGVGIRASGARVALERFVQRGAPNPVPEYLHLGAWQMLNVPSIEDNLASLTRGIRQAAKAGVEIVPCGVVKVPARARSEVAWSECRKGLLSGRYCVRRNSGACAGGEAWP